MKDRNENLGNALWDILIFHLQGVLKSEEQLTVR